MSDIEPNWSDSKVPNCSDECPSHDGKRCRVMGFRPDTICEPAVELAMQRLDDLQGVGKVVVGWYGTNTPGTHMPPGMKELKALIGETP